MVDSTIERDVIIYRRNRKVEGWLEHCCSQTSEHSYQVGVAEKSVQMT